MTKDIAEEYLKDLSKTINELDVSAICDVANTVKTAVKNGKQIFCLLYTSPSPRDGLLSRMPSSA